MAVSLPGRAKIRNVPKARPATSAQTATRRRDAVLLSAIRDATFAELTDHGYAGVTFEGVARRAQTGKPVLYRRYSSRAQMVADALPTVRSAPVITAHCTSLRDDVLALLDAVVSGWRDIGIETYRSLIAEADDDTLQAFQVKVTEWADQTIRIVLGRARERGELGPAPIADRVATSILALIRNEMFFARAPVDRSALADMVDLIYLPALTAASYR